MTKIIAFRGEYGPTSDKRVCCSRQKAIYFSSRPVAEVYSKQPNHPSDVVIESRVMQAVLRIEKPFIYQDSSCFIDLDGIAGILGREEALRIAVKFEKSITRTGLWRDFIENAKSPKYADLPDPIEYNEYMKLLAEMKGMKICLDFEAYHFFDDNEEVEKLMALGYDGAMHLGNGESALIVECCVFSEDQITPIQVTYN